MRLTKFIPVALCCVAALAFTSCNDDDDWGKLSPEQTGQALTAMRGNYSGKLIYQRPKDSSKQAMADYSTWVNDSIDSQWSVAADTTLTVPQFPVNIIANYVNGNDSLQAALAEATPADIVCGLDFYRLEPIIFNQNAKPLELNLNYGGSAHKVRIYFYTNNGWSYSYYSCGEYNQQTKRFIMQLALGGIFVDGKDVNYLRGTFGLVFEGTKI